jgi:hypothetical protein
MKTLFFLILLLPFSICFGQTVALPYHFESGSIVNGNFTNFDGGTGTVIANPQISAGNPSATVGRMVRNGGQPWAGAYLTTPSNVNFSVNPIICMKVFTTAPIGTRIALKMEGCSGGCSREVDAFTTVSGAWETLCYDYTGQPTSFNRLVFLFDLGNVGNGSAASTFLFDDVEQLASAPLQATPGSQYFCPSTSLTLTFPGSGSYNWYADPAGTFLLQAGSPTYVTPVLSADASYYVQDMTPTPFPQTNIGPSIPGGTSIGNSITVSTFFTSNLDNGFFHGVDIMLHIPTGPVPGNTCTYRVDIFNITQGTSRSQTQGFVSPVNFSQHTYSFGFPLPIFLNDQIEMRITSLTAHPCYCISSSAGNNGLFLPFPSSYDPQVTFTSHTSNGSSNTLMSGLNYNLSGDFVDPTLSQVNAIANCALPIELLEFSVNEDQGNALLSWTTGTELNNDYFLVKRSRDGLLFETLGRVQGSGNSSSSLQYSFSDTDVQEGLSYYQLEQVDRNGATSLSEILAYTKSTPNTIRVFPNPTSGAFTVSGDIAVKSAVEIQVQDFTGRILAHYNLMESPGALAKAFDIGDYPAGIYSVTVRMQHESRVFKLVKQ